MKFLIVATFLLVGFASAHQDPAAMEQRMEEFKAKRAEWHAKWQTMSEEERQQQIAKIQSVHQEKLANLEAKFESFTPEKRSQIIARVEAKLPAQLRAKIADLSNEEKAQLLQEKLQQFNAMAPEQKKAIMQKMAKFHQRQLRGSQPAPAAVE